MVKLSLLGIVTALVIIVGIAGFFLGQANAPRILQTVTVEKTVVRTVTQQVTQQPAAQPQQTIPDKIVVGFTVGLTGSYAIDVRDSMWGIQAATKWVNDVYGGIKIGGKRVKIELKYYDDQSSRDIAPSLYERLITVDKVDFLLGPYGSPLVIATAPVAEKYGKLMISWGGASDAIFAQGFRWIVQSLTPSTGYLRATMDMIKALDPGAKIAIIYKDDEFNRYVAIGGRDRAKELGLNIIFYKSYPPGTSDFAPIYSEAATYKPDIIIVTGHVGDGMLAAKQLAEYNVNARLIIIVGGAVSYGEFYRSLGRLAEGIAGPSQWEEDALYSPEVAKKLGIEWFGPTREEFLRIFYEIAGSTAKPTYLVGVGASGILMLVKAIEIAQSLDQKAVREAMNKMDILTFFGRLKIDPTTGKQIGHEMFVTQWQGGKLKVIWPPEVATSKPVYPIPTWDEKRQGKEAIP
jgi:branched-chain amino acid transport system substrate-binding protein